MNPSRDPADFLEAFQISQVAFAGSTLGLYDLLAASPATAAELARLTSTHELSLSRLLRTLTGLGILEEASEERYALTGLGDRLRQGPFTAMAAVFSTPQLWSGWGRLADCVRSGSSAFGGKQEAAAFDGSSPEDGFWATFHTAMSATVRPVAEGLALLRVFLDARKVVDLGGGAAVVMVELMSNHPQLRGLVLDLPEVTPGARAALQEAKLADRCEVVEGSFFDHVPAGGDVYLLVRVLHDWPDEDAARILARCSAVMSEQTSLLVVDRVIDDRSGVGPLLADLNMLVLTGGRERTLRQWGELFDAAGLTLGPVSALHGPFSVLEVRKA